MSTLVWRLQSSIKHLSQIAVAIVALGALGCGSNGFKHRPAILAPESMATPPDSSVTGSIDQILTPEPDATQSPPNPSSSTSAESPIDPPDPTPAKESSASDPLMAPSPVDEIDSSLSAMAYLPMDSSSNENAPEYLEEPVGLPQVKNQTEPSITTTPPAIPPRGADKPPVANHANNGTKESSRPPLSWEKRNPDTKVWSSFLEALIETELLASFDQAKDVANFCPKYRVLPKALRANFWAQLVAALALYESGYNPRARMRETYMHHQDGVTNLPIYSEGLLQLSYQDVSWYKFCKMDWSADKDLSPTDSAKTIFDPFINLDCGTRILANQIRRTGQIMVSRGAYWAVLQPTNQNQQINKIRQITQSLPYCTNH